MVISWLSEHWALLLQLTWAHIWLTAAPTLLGVVLSVPLGYCAYKYPRSYIALVGGTSLFYTVPSLALFILIPRLFGIQILNPLNVVIAIVIYTLSLMVRVIADGLHAVPRDTVAAARGIGYSRLQIFLHVEAPLALPAFLSGLRVVVVSNISIVTVAAIVGIAQLGSLFTMGFTRRLYTPIVVGLVECLVLAILSDRLLALVTELVTPWRRKGAA